MRYVISAIAAIALFGAPLPAAPDQQPSKWLPGVMIPSPPLPPSSNALDDFHKAYTLEMEKSVIDKPGAKLTLQQKKRILEDNQETIDSIHIGLSHEYMPPANRSFATRNTHSVEERSLGNLLKLAADTRREEGDWSGSARSALDDIHFGLKIENQADGMGYLSGLICEIYGREALWSAIDHLPGPEAHAAGAELSAWTSKRPTYTDLLQNEKWAHQASFIEMFEKAKPADMAVIQKDLGIKDPHDLLDLYTAKIDAWIASSRQPFATRAVPDTTDKLSTMIIPDHRRGLFRYDDCRAQDGLLITTLALHAYYAEHKSYPDTLNALVPKYLNAVPADPFSKGETLRYKPTGSAYRLYSIGPDGIDDGGTAIHNPTFKPDTPEGQRAIVSPALNSKGDIVAGVNL